MKLKYHDSYAFQEQYSNIKAALRNCKTNHKYFLTYGLVNPSDAEDHETDFTYVDVGEFSTEPTTKHSMYTVDRWVKCFPPIGDKPFWYMGKRYTVQQFKGLMLLVS